MECSGTVSQFCLFLQILQHDISSKFDCFFYNLIMSMNKKSASRKQEEDSRSGEGKPFAEIESDTYSRRIAEAYIDELQMQTDTRKQEENIVGLESVNVKMLLKKCSMLEKVMISRDDRPIFIFDTHFESDQEDTYGEQPSQGSDNRGENVHLIKRAYQSSLPSCKMQSEEIEYVVHQGPSDSRFRQDDVMAFIQREDMGAMLDWNMTAATSKQKSVYISLRAKLEQLQRIVASEQEKKKKRTKDHCCSFCGLQFENGRELGGHISRKHPGCSSDYSTKRRLHQIKKIEKERRKFFKARRAV